jgi:hypothetical protein
MTDIDNGYSPFDAPVREPKTTKPTETSGGIKMEQITDAELDGNKNINDIPGDAPTFEIPKFDEIPNMPGTGPGDPFAPGGSGSGGGKSGGGSNGGGGNDSGGGGGTKLNDGFAKEFSEYTAKWLIDIFFRLLIAGFTQYAKIDRTEILRAVNDGFIDQKFLKFVDEANDNVDKTINVTDDEKKFVIEPLKYFLEAKKIQLKPEWMFITGLLMVGGGLFIKSMDVKNQNKALLDRVIKESAKMREDAAAERRNKQPVYNERTEDFRQSTAESKFNEPVNFTEPIKKETNIEIVATEEVDPEN